MKHRGQRWTNEEINLAKQLYEDGKKMEEISLIVNHTESAINHKLKEIGVQRIKRVDWTEEDCDKLKKLVKQNLSYSEIAKILGKTNRGCQAKAIRLGIKTKECNVWENNTRSDFWSEQEIDNLKKLVIGNKSASEISYELKRSYKSICCKMYELGIMIKDKTDEQKSLYRRVYTVNDDYFENIDSQKKAYWLGWMITDGYVIEKLHTTRGDIKSNRVGLHLQSIDEYVLIDFKNDLNTNFPIKNKRKRTVKEFKNKHTGEIRSINSNESKTLDMTSAKMVQDLSKYGIHQNKTYDVVFPKELKEEFYPGFISGVISGDGSVNIKDNHHKGKIIRVNIAGTENLLKGIKEALVKNIGFNPEKKIMKLNSSKCLYNIELNQTETFALHEWFQKNDVKLMERKQKILEDYINAYNSI